MHVIIARNVNEAYRLGAGLIQRDAVRAPSRNGDVLVVRQPVSTMYEHPRERVLYDLRRDANPFLHLFDALWCLAGRQDVGWLAQFAARMADFSDDGITLHGAYGYRWRHAHGHDQLHEIISLLQRDPTTRRAVLQMWDASADLASPSKDVPCNLMIHFMQDNGSLNMTVFNRSNDMIWGAYGANAVQFSVLQEYIASSCGWQVGWYEQVSANFHVYLPVWEKHFDHGYVEPYLSDPYEQGTVAPYPLVESITYFDEDLQRFVAAAHPRHQHDLFTREPEVYSNAFFPNVAVPMLKAWRCHKLGERGDAMDWVHNCRASDWALAAQQWLGRRDT